MWSSLSGFPREQLAAAIGVDSRIVKITVMKWALQDLQPSFRAILDLWKNNGWCSRSRNWRSLYDVLEELDLEWMAQEIDKYLSCKFIVSSSCSQYLYSSSIYSSSMLIRLHVSSPQVSEGPVHVSHHICPTVAGT